MSLSLAFRRNGRSRPIRSFVFALSAAALLGGAVAARAEDDTFRATIVEQSADDVAISGFYAAHDYRTLWTGSEDAARRAALFAALDHADDHGLPTARYDVAGLRAAFRAVRTERQRAKTELLATRTFLSYARDVQTGYLIPGRIDAGIVREVPRRDPRMQLEQFAVADPAGFIAGLPPDVPEYAALQKARFDLEAAIAAGGWGPEVPKGRYAVGESGPAVVALRDRLAMLGYLRPSVTRTYDDEIAGAVQQFQTDQGLHADGVAGEATIDELNRSPEDRLRSVLVAMERLRWMNGVPLGQRHIWVNLPDFTAKVIDDDKVTFESVTVIGMNQPDRESPEFSDLMEFMVVNPSWSVPRSITVKEYLPMLQRNPNAAGHLRIVDRRGRVIDRTQIDFTQYTERTFPFSMRQPPSDGNALGLVKFMFPNPWNIYLHDTPSKSLFQKDVRAFSHGCIRLGQPFDLAYTLLARQSDDPRGLFQSYLATGREGVLKLKTPVPVHLVYFTAWPDARGRIDYRRDVYGRDAEVFAAMEKAGLEMAPVQKTGVETAGIQG